MLQSRPWRPHPTGHDQPVGVTFQFLLVGRPVIESSGRYSASKLMTSLPQRGHKRAVENPFKSGKSRQVMAIYQNARFAFFLEQNHCEADSLPRMQRRRSTPVCKVTQRMNMRKLCFKRLRPV